MKNNISIHINFYQNRFINECARKIKASESQSFRVSKFQSEMWKNLRS